MSSKLDFVGLLYQALAAERWGIKVETEDIDRLIVKLHEAKKMRAEFAALSFIRSPLNPSVLFIAKKQGKPDAEKP
jgi:hypothetical protein